MSKMCISEWGFVREGFCSMGFCPGFVHYDTFVCGHDAPETKDCDEGSARK